MFENLGQFADLMRNAGKMREMMEQASEKLGRLQVEGTSGGGAVTVKVNGLMEVLAVRLSPKLVAEGDTELLEELIAAAVNQAIAKARETAAQTITAGSPFSLPPGYPGS